MDNTEIYIVRLIDPDNRTNNIIAVSPDRNKVVKEAKSYARARYIEMNGSESDEYCDYPTADDYANEVESFLATQDEFLDDNTFDEDYKITKHTMTF